MADLAWYKAAGVLRLTLGKRAAGWPESFKIGELAWLQYPPEGAAEQRVAARKRRGAFEAAIKDAIAADIIRTDNAVEQRTSRVGVGYLDPFRFNLTECPGVALRVPRYQETHYEVTVVRLTRAAFAQWWGQQRESASEHIVAWLDSGNELSTTPVTAGNGGAHSKWSRGLKLVAWECAGRLRKDEGTITGPALWDAMCADARVQIKESESLVFKSNTTSLTGGEVSAKAKTIRGDWRQQLADLLS
jgi:hypothetical protein